MYCSIIFGGYSPCFPGGPRASGKYNVSAVLCFPALSIVLGGALFGLLIGIARGLSRRML